VPFVYQSGETIMHGDRVLYGGNPGEIEFIIDPCAKLWVGALPTRTAGGEDSTYGSGPVTNPLP
jgi:hypothetical protein